ncbi:hypothetical protein N9872_01445 [Paraglaciecola sp.]|nr:hypothetical protein [Paraglaciecola sp.]MDA9367927.1 hypothetical protein [Flavobacteriaceae bacterium]MDB4281618.1 hypothetical protein [Paraglaciecola sp.]
MKLKNVLLLMPLTVLAVPYSALSQTVPADLMDLSIEDLFTANVVSEEEQQKDKKRWHVSYTYGKSRFEEYYTGSQSLSYEDVLWRPGEVRTKDNYPVVPTEISQEIHAFLIGYDLNQDITLRIAVPFIKQSSDHISIIPGYDAFNISSSGVGDVVVLADMPIARTMNSIWRIGAGLSLPTGSIDEQGDTPRAPGNQQLPYTMQIGSGTFDMPLLASYEKFESGFRWGVDAGATLRLNENDRDYRLGHKFSLGSWIKFTSLGPIEPGIRLAYRWQGKISGEDTDLSVPVPAFPYPAPVVDPDDFGGQQVDLAVFARLPLGTNGWYVEANYSQPVYRDLNGPQSSEKFHTNITIGTSF